MGAFLVLVVTVYLYGAEAEQQHGVKLEPDVATCAADAAKVKALYMGRDKVRDVRTDCLLFRAPEPRSRT